VAGNERMVEGERFDDGAGNSRTRDEQFTASYTLTPTSADTRPIFINGEPSTAIFGNISGQAHCTPTRSRAPMSIRR